MAPRPLALEPAAPPLDLLPDRPRKGRGAIRNETGRFETQTRHAVDDGWGLEEELADDVPPLRTTVTIDSTRTIIAYNKSPDIPFDRSINPYRGCEHGCIYCFARPTHAFLGLSPGLDFESRLLVKPDAARLLEAELADPKYKCDIIAMGTNTDPYQPIERDYRITRQILEVLAAHDHPVSIVTKSALILRDLDILAPMAKKGLAAVGVSVTTLDRGLARRMEPRAATPARRLETIAALSEAGVPTAVMAAPMIPALNDMELERILKAAVGAGAVAAGYVMLRLPLEIKDLFGDWLTAHFPDRAARVLKLVRETRGGMLYQAEFGRRMRGDGPYADLIAQRFDAACRRLGINAEERRAETDRRWHLVTTRFRRPARTGDQLSLL
ncbi:MAG: PA0069 family radical SAM protein [Candidatus Eiseniibacteriota bacterium]